MKKVGERRRKREVKEEGEGRRRKKVNEECTTTTGTKHTLNTLLHWVYQASRRIDHVLSSVAT